MNFMFLIKKRKNICVYWNLCNVKEADTVEVSAFYFGKR